MTRVAHHLTSAPLLACFLLAVTAARAHPDGPEREPARLIEAGQCREAASLLEANSGSATASPEMRVLLGWAYLGMGRYSEAEAVVDQPGPPGIEPARLEIRGRAAEVRGDLDRALAALTQAIEARRQSLSSVESLDGAATLAEGRTLLGDLAFGAGRLDLAKDQFQKAITGVSDAHARLHAQDIPHDERDPRLLAGGATAGLARVYGAKGDAARAERSWRGVMARTDDPAVLTDLVAFYIARNDVKSAGRHRERALKLTEGKPAHRRTRAALLADRAETLREALTLAEAAYRDGPDIHARDTLAWVLHRQGDDARAREILQPALDLGSRDPMLLYHAGLIAQARHDVPEAKRLLTACLALNPAFDPVAAPDATRRLQALR